MKEGAVALDKLPAAMLAAEAVFIVPGPDHTAIVSGDADLDGAGPGRFVSRQCDEMIMDTGYGGVALDRAVKLVELRPSTYNRWRVVWRESVDEHTIIGEQRRHSGPLSSCYAVGIMRGQLFNFLTIGELLNLLF